MKGYLYILLCSNGQFYTGSTRDIEKRMYEHNNGEGANFTKKHLPVKLVYLQEFSRIDEAFYREKQIQGWSHKKKEALINGDTNQMHSLAECRNDSHCKNRGFDSPSTPLGNHAQPPGGKGSLRLRSVTEEKQTFGLTQSSQEVPFDSPSATLRNHAQGTGGTRSLEEREPRSLSGVETTDSGGIG